MLDDLDHRLLAALRADSRMPTAQLAREFGVNRATVTSRIDRLRECGVIEAFTLRLRGDVDRDVLRGITLVALAPNQGQNVIRKVRGFPEVEHLYSTTGAWDLVLMLRIATPSEFDRVLERIRAIQGVMDTQTNLLFALTGGE